MKILQSSDWHLGQSFFTQNRKDEHQQFLDWLLLVVEAQQIDAIIVAGDVFDTGTPPSYAREMYNRFVVALQAHRCTLIVLGGNHDSVSVLNETRGLLSCLNTHVIASVLEDPADQVVELKDKNGDTGAFVCAIPFIRPRDVLVSAAGQSTDEKKQHLGDAIKAHYRSVYDVAAERREASGKPVPVIATGHLTALGVSASSSVRDIYIGTLEGFAADGFPPADYIALGHIHRPQKVAKSEHIRYSGSPVALSFDELGTQKQVVLVSFEGSTTPVIETLPVPVFQPMAVIRGDLDTIEQSLKAFTDPAATTWLCIEVTTQGYLSDLHQRIQAMTEDKPVEVLQLRRVHERAASSLTAEYEQDLSELSPEEVFERRLLLMDDATEAEVKAELRTQFREVVSGLDAGEAAQ